MQDYLIELNHLGLTARIKRLNDSLNYNIKRLYISQNLDIEPSWHLVLLILRKNQQLSLSDLSKRLQISQPAITKLVKKMSAKGYVQLSPSTKDTRVKHIHLTKKSMDTFPKWERVWSVGEQVIGEMLEGNEVFIDALTDFESEQQQLPFLERTKRLLKEK